MYAASATRTSLGDSVTVLQAVALPQPQPHGVLVVAVGRVERSLGVRGYDVVRERREGVGLAHAEERLCPSQAPAGLGHRVEPVALRRVAAAVDVAIGVARGARVDRERPRRDVVRDERAAVEQGLAPLGGGRPLGPRPRPASRPRRARRVRPAASTNVSVSLRRSAVTTRPPGRNATAEGLAPTAMARSSVSARASGALTTRLSEPPPAIAIRPEAASTASASSATTGSDGRSDRLSASRLPGPGVGERRPRSRRARTARRRITLSSPSTDRRSRDSVRSSYVASSKPESAAAPPASGGRAVSLALGFVRYDHHVAARERPSRWSGRSGPATVLRHRIQSRPCD